MTSSDIRDVVESVRPALRKANLSEADRTQFLYDLIREVHTYVKFEIDGGQNMMLERARVGKLADLANPANRYDE